ncbi:sulfotransferase family 2 domain-containing protein [Microbulbifer harenosus]|uniref:Sulfotransferase family protein n=1 Tax=Microbulbifer harenosus TaxID=2576840 RepID=A0ABY2UN16_9GAMM|nr:sulfotransferase family 2 domain-containing protein [Microbulbifer harenosus]TLM80011.1 sulfotransferase family protein [Microbulbifer harenosus]
MSVSPLVFVHVPKTAGTSFRLGVDQFFGEDRVCRDYGAGSSDTSAIVNECLYERSDMWDFRLKFEQSNYQFLTGHFGASRYMPAFPVVNMITFLRDPLQRTVSEYHHLVKHAGYEGSLEQFYRSPQFINRQHNMFRGVHWAALGFVGITERYDESLDLLRDGFGLDVPRMESNTGRENWREPYRLSEDQEIEFRRLNAADIRLYNMARDQFDWRTKLRRRGDPYVSGMVTEYRDQQLMGWAYATGAQSPAYIQVSVNGKLRAEVAAKGFRQGLHAYGVPRGANIGFSVKLPSLTSKDLVECTVATTGQPLANSPWRLPKQVPGKA